MLDCPGAAGRVGHAVQIALLLKDQRDIAREAPGQGVGQAHGMVEGQGGEARDAAGGRREGGDRGAQEVAHELARREHAGGGLGVQPKSGQRPLRTDRAQHLPPERSSRAQLREREEIVGVGGKGQRHLGGRGTRGQARRRQGAQIRDAGGDSGSQLLGLAGPGSVIRAPVGQQGRDARPLRGHLGRQDGGRPHRFGQLQRCPARGGTQRVDVEQGDGGRSDATLVQKGQQQPRRLEPAAPAIERDRHRFEGHTFESTGEPIEVVGQNPIGDRAAAAQLLVQAQDDRGDAAIQILADLAVGLGRVGMGVALPDVPGHRAGPRNRRRQGCPIVRPIEGLDLDQIGRSADQRRQPVRPAQDSGDRPAPGCGRPASCHPALLLLRLHGGVLPISSACPWCPDHATDRRHAARRQCGSRAPAPSGPTLGCSSPSPVPNLPRVRSREHIGNCR